MADDDPYANRVKLGAMIRAAAAAAVHDEEQIPELKRLNDMAACETFLSALTLAGCMITRIPRRGGP